MDIFHAMVRTDQNMLSGHSVILTADDG